MTNDYTDEKALERRMSVRERHLEGAKILKAEGHFVLGGALLSSEGKMMGSMMVVDFETETQLKDPYVTGKVWEKIDIKPFKKADF